MTSRFEGCRVVDYFAGLGGFTLGASRAGATVVQAINHWPLAVEMHRRNHPSVAHACEDLTRFDPRRLPAFDVLTAGPACQGHSLANGAAVGTEHYASWDASRATAWSVIDCAEVRRPRGIVVENVMRFVKWKLWDLWWQALRALGYEVRVQCCDAQHYGAPQERPRVIVTAVLGREAPQVPGARAVYERSEVVTLGGRREAVWRWRKLPLPRVRPVPIVEVIAWSEGEWSRIDRPGRSPATLARVARGRARFGARFVMPYNGSGSGLTGRSLARPLGTVTAADRWAVVDGDRMRMFTLSELRAAMGFPEGYELPRVRKDATEMVGNAIVPALARRAVRAVMEAVS